jgi:hypothetical protein
MRARPVRSAVKKARSRMLPGEEGWPVSRNAQVTVGRPDGQAAEGVRSLAVRWILPGRLLITAPRRYAARSGSR